MESARCPTRKNTAERVERALERGERCLRAAFVFLPANQSGAQTTLAALQVKNMKDGQHTESEPSTVSDLTHLTVPAPRAARRAKWAEIVFFFCLAAFALLAVLANRYAYFEWDLALARDIQSITLPAFDSVMVGVSLLGNGWIPWALVIIAGVALIIGGLRIEGILLMSFAGSGWLVNRLWKLLIGRP